ncbi:MAG: PPOX class F420-dependent oxidoreductase [Actinomycetota bacterium]|nr:PPOX class F420-dependent oxidoreductase [Actinomycetota bacterium]
MKKIPRDDPRAQHMAGDEPLDRDELAAHLAGKNHWVLATTRRDGRPQLSLVTGGMTADGVLAVSTYPQRAKAANARRDPNVSVLVLGDKFNDSWVQIDGQARVLDMPEASDAFVEYFRCISGEHPDWDEYRQAMADQGKCMILIEPTRWGPLSRGGFPPELFEDA